MHTGLSEKEAIRNDVVLTGSARHLRLFCRRFPGRCQTLERTQDDGMGTKQEIELRLQTWR